MIRPQRNTIVIAALLALAALVCLGVGLHLLAAAGQQAAANMGTTAVALVSRLAIVGGFLIFLLGTIALLAARRLAFGAQPLTEPAHSSPFNQIDIQDWGRELADIRDHMRQDIDGEAGEAAVTHCDLFVPHSWRPLGEYVIRTDGQPTDPLADLKRTRNQLMEAAERVDSIVQNINDITSSNGQTDNYNKGNWRRVIAGLLRRR